MQRTLVLPLILILLIQGVLIAANPTGAYPDSFTAIDVTLHLDVSNGNDTNAGTWNARLKTLTNALEQAKSSNSAGYRVKVLVYPGIYRESAYIVHDNHAPLVIEATETGAAIISGSDVFTGWNDEGGGVYSHAWTNNFQSEGIQMDFDPDPEVYARREMAFADDAPLIQVSTNGEAGASDLAGVISGFCVNTNDAVNKIYIKTGGNPNAQKIEVSVRPSRLSNALIRYLHKRNVKIKGIIFEHAANSFWLSPALDLRWNYITNIYIVDCVFRHNNGSGVGGEMQSSTISNCRSYSNGFAGMDIGKTNAIMADCVIAHNNWRGASVGYTGWSVAGMKSTELSNVAIYRTKYLSNYTHGLWFDVNVADVLVDSCEFISNQGYGVYYEMSHGPALFRNCAIYDNEDAGFTYSGSWLFGATLSNSFISNNNYAQIKQISETRGGLFDGSTIYWNDGFKLIGNVIAGRRDRYTHLITVSETAGDSNYVRQRAISNMTLESNTYIAPVNEMAFVIDLNSPTGNEKVLTRTNLAGWRWYTGNDLTSSVATVAGNYAAASHIEIEMFDEQTGITSSEYNGSWIGPHSGDILIFRNVDFEGNANKLRVRSASVGATAPNGMDVWISNSTAGGPASNVGTFTFQDTGNWTRFSNSVMTISNVSGVQDVHLHITATVSLDWLSFYDDTPPSAPTGLSGEMRTVHRIPLSWNTNGESDFSHYALHRSTVSNFTVTNTNELVTLSSNNYIDAAAEPNETYYYKLVAYDLFGNVSAVSSQIAIVVPAADGTAPGQPRGFFARAASPTSIALFFETNTESDIAGYNIYRSTNNSFVTNNETLFAYLVTTNYRLDSGLANETMYYYKLAAVDYSENESVAANAHARTGDLILAYDFDVTSNAALVYDTRGNFEGVLSGATYTSDARTGSALAFGGVATEYVSVPHEALLYQNDFSFGCWIKTGISRSQTLLSLASAGNANELLISFADSRTAHFEMAGTIVEWTIPTIANGAWHHAMFVRESASNTVTFYLDGENKGAQPLSAGTVTVASNGFFIGQDQDVLGGGFEAGQALYGAVDALRLYNRALSNNEVVGQYMTTNHFAIDITKCTRLEAPVTIMTDAGGYAYLTAAEGTEASEDTAPTNGFAEYTVSLSETSEYILWGEFYTPTATETTMWLFIDDSSAFKWQTWFAPDWHYDKANDALSASDPLVLTLTEGVHTVRLAYGSSLLRLRTLVLTKNTNDVPYVGTNELVLNAKRIGVLHNVATPNTMATVEFGLYVNDLYEGALPTRVTKDVVLTITDVRGALVMRKEVSTDDYFIQWDYKNTAGKTVKNGVYIYTLTITQDGNEASKKGVIVVAQ